MHLLFKLGSRIKQGSRYFKTGKNELLDVCAEGKKLWRSQFSVENAGPANP